MARLEKPSMLLKMPGIMAQGEFQPSLALIQKHRGQESGRARMPRFLAEIRMGRLVRLWCIGGKRGLGGGRFCPSPSALIYLWRLLRNAGWE